MADVNDNVTFRAKHENRDEFSALQESTFRNAGTIEDDFGKFQKNSEADCNDSLEEILQINDIS